MLPEQRLALFCYSYAAHTEIPETVSSYGILRSGSKFLSCNVGELEVQTESGKRSVPSGTKDRGLFCYILVIRLSTFSCLTL